MAIFSTILNALERLVHSHRAMSMDEVNDALAKRAAAKEETTKEPLDWNRSVVDLLKLLDMDTSFQARRSLATELGLDGTFVGSEDQNVALHELVMRDVAKRCTPIPKE